MRVLFLWWTLEILLTDASVTHHVYWNSTNTLFDTFEGAIDSPGYYEISAPARDYIKFHCPKRKSREFSLVYQVSKESFERCTLLDGSELVGSCDGQHKAFTVPLKTLKSPIEETVYYISTSTGLIDGLQSQRFGLCLSKNMRLAVSLELHETLPLEGVLNGLELESKGLADGTLYLIEENNEILWKKNVHPSISKDLNEKLRKSYKFDKNKELAEPIPISYEFFTEKLEEMHSPEEQYIFPRPHPKAIKEDVVMSTGSLSPLLFVLVTLYILL